MRSRPATRALVAVDVAAAIALVAAVTIVGIRLERQAEAPRSEARSEVTASPEAGNRSAGRSARPPTLDGCRKAGITRNAGVGSCRLPDGTQITAVGRDATLELEEISVRYLGERVFKRLRAGSESLRPQGVFLAVRLRITNNLTDTVGLESNRIALILGDDVYAQSLFAAETSRASLQQQAAELGRGRSASGELVFDVPRAAVGGFERSGTVRIFQFTDDPETAATGKPVGFLRTYA